MYYRGHGGRPPLGPEPPVLFRPKPSSTSIPLNDQAHAAVAKKQAALRKSGNEILIDRRAPVRSGAKIPESRDRADAIPLAVPLVTEEDDGEVRASC